MAKYVLALDQGTTSSRAIVFNHDGLIVTSAQQEFPQIYPKPGEVEHDPEAIWSSQLAVAQEAMKKAGATASDIAAIASLISAKQRSFGTRTQVSLFSMLLSGRAG